MLRRARLLLPLIAATLTIASCTEARRRGPSDPDAGAHDAGPLDASTDAGPGPRDAEPMDAPARDTGTGGDDAGPTCETSYTCPAGATQTTDGAGNAVCRWEGFDVPDTPSLEPYCTYLSDGYVGFSWDLGADPDYECPSGTRHAPSSELDFCLWEDLSPPAGATARCDRVAEGVIGFAWPCD